MILKPVLEGIGGSGKSSTLSKIEKLLSKEYAVIVVRKKCIINSPEEYGIIEKDFFCELNNLCWNYAQNYCFENIPIKTWITYMPFGTILCLLN